MTWPSPALATPVASASVSTSSPGKQNGLTAVSAAAKAPRSASPGQRPGNLVQPNPAPPRRGGATLASLRYEPLLEFNLLARQYRSDPAPSPAHRWLRKKTGNHHAASSPAKERARGNRSRAG